MGKHKITGHVERFPGKNGWTYLRFSKQLSEKLRPEVQVAWPALIKAICTLGQSRWKGTIMPIKDGPLFITLPPKIREAESIKLGDRVTVTIEPVAP